MNPTSTYASYRDARPTYEEFAARMSSLALDLMKAANIPVAQVEHRAKTVESYQAKLKLKHYEDNPDRIKDLAGVRVITYYNDDVQRAADVIRGELTVSPNDSMDKLQDLDVNEFGYRSLHLVCQVGPVRARLGEWQSFAGFHVEIQVRSVLQHAWAAISHKLDYKSVTQAPADLRRQLFRLSALLELADEEFAKIRDTSNRLEDDYAEGVPAGELDFDINVQSLTAFLRDKVELEEWERVGRSAGFAPGNPSRGEFERTLPLVVDMFQALGLTTLDDVDGVLAAIKPSAEVTLLEKVQVSANRHEYVVEAFPLDVIILVTLANYGSHVPASVFATASYKKAFRAILADLMDTGQPPA